MEQTKRTYVHTAFEEGYTCVFPTEVAARGFLVDYTLHGKHKAILAERAISFDMFRAQFLPKHAQEQPANTLIRQLFARTLLDTPHALSYFINPSFPEANSRFSKYLSSLLPQLAQALDEEVLALMSLPMQQDVKILYQEYTSFLSEHKLFEPGYERPSLQFADEEVFTKKYCILFPSLIAGVNGLIESLGSPSWITLKPTPATIGPTVQLEVFDNHVEEIRTTLRRIRHLLDEGVPTRDILIGCASPSSMLPSLEQEAWLYDIPLVLRQGRSPLLYPSGRFFSRLKEVYEERFSLESMKALLLDIGFPWRDLPTQRRLLETAVDRAVVQGSLWGSDQWTEQLRNTSLITWYKSFKDSVVGMCTAKNIEELRKKLNHFQDTYFIDTQWTGTQGEDVYSFCLDAMESIKAAMASLSLISYPSIFSFFLEFLDTKLYVPQMTEGGIQVYPWPLTAPLEARHHFILALDHVGSRCLEQPLALLPQTVETKDRREEDTTVATFEAALLAEGELYLSYHTSSYEGEALPPTYFLEQNLITGRRAEIAEACDPFIGESLIWRGEAPLSQATNRQQWWFAKAIHTSLSSNRSDFARKAIPPDWVPLLKVENEGKRRIHLSPTGLDLFVRCPYAWLCKYLFEVDQAEYQVQSVDHRLIGSFLHAVYEAFFREIEYFSPNKMEAYRLLLLSLFDQKLIEFFGEGGPNPPTRAWIIYEFRERCTLILEAEEKLFAHTRSIFFEKKLSFVDELFALEGRIDRIICLDPPEGKLYAVIDYKKGKAPFSKIKDKIPSYQLPLYRKLVGEDLGSDAVNASYFSIKDGRYSAIWDRDETAIMAFCDKALEDVLKKMAMSIEGGHLEATPSKDTCKACIYRPVCRRRFATR
ncbi:MAG TPA: PD-(D/E)XK nuclease family protein [Sphaerochaeta sp.]|nr:PD-(D/E)XK nuclease family protein [Sphaerochaeta sp.]